MISIVDYGAGNLASVKKAFDYLGFEAVVTGNPDVVSASERIVLPGVGHFSSLRGLNGKGLGKIVLQSIHGGKPFLGICLGMQWLFEGSEECGELAGAGMFAGRCRQFSSAVKSPHVGWNSLRLKGTPRLLRNIAPDSFVYFTHSFHAPLIRETSATCEYGTDFAAAVEQNNIFAVQFHPEKSGEVGLAILKNFCEA